MTNSTTRILVWACAIWATFLGGAVGLEVGLSICDVLGIEAPPRPPDNAVRKSVLVVCESVGFLLPLVAAFVYLRYSRQPRKLPKETRPRQSLVIDGAPNTAEKSMPVATGHVGPLRGRHTPKVPARLQPFQFALRTLLAVSTASALIFASMASGMAVAAVAVAVGLIGLLLKRRKQSKPVRQSFVVTLYAVAFLVPGYWVGDDLVIGAQVFLFTIPWVVWKPSWLANVLFWIAFAHWRNNRSRTATAYGIVAALLASTELAASFFLRPRLDAISQDFWVEPFRLLDNPSYCLWLGSIILLSAYALIEQRAEGATSKHARSIRCAEETED